MIKIKYYINMSCTGVHAVPCTSIAFSQCNASHCNPYRNPPSLRARLRPPRKERLVQSIMPFSSSPHTKMHPSITSVTSRRSDGAPLVRATFVGLTFGHLHPHPHGWADAADQLRTEPQAGRHEGMLLRVFALTNATQFLSRSRRKQDFLFVVAAFSPRACS